MAQRCHGGRHLSRQQNPATDDTMGPLLEPKPQRGVIPVLRGEPVTPDNRLSEKGAGA